MSSTNRGAVRDPSDWYRTPAWAVAAILPHVITPDVKTVLDPACGDGAILDVVKALHPSISRTGFELDDVRADETRRKGHYVVTSDAFNVHRDAWQVDLILANYPFSLAQTFIEMSIARATTTAALLRLAYMAGKKRKKFWRKNPADVFVLEQRPAFCASIKCSKKKSGCDYAELLPIDAPRPSKCPKCGSRATVTTTDSADYAWFVWGPGRGGRWDVLDCNDGEWPVPMLRASAAEFAQEPSF